MTIKNQFQQETQGNVLTKLAKNMVISGLWRLHALANTRLVRPCSNGTKDGFKRQRFSEPRAPHRQGHLPGDTRDSRRTVTTSRRWCDADRVRKTTRLPATGNNHSIQGYTIYATRRRKTLADAWPTLLLFTSNSIIHATCSFSSAELAKPGLMVLQSIADFVATYLGWLFFLPSSMGITSHCKDPY